MNVPKKDQLSLQTDMLLLAVGVRVWAAADPSDEDPSEEADP